MKKIILKILKITGIVFGSILLLMFLLPYLFPDTVARKIKEWTNSSINGELNFSKARLSFFNHFPSLTLTLYDFTLKGSAPFQKDTLIAANEVALGIDLRTVFSKKIKINELYLTKGLVNIEVNEKGEANYNVYKSTADTAAQNANDTGSASLKIQKIILEQSHIIYDDKSLPMYINAHGFNYKGTGDLSNAVFDLKTRADIDSLDLYYDNVPYVLSKKVHASLVTKINTNSLALTFQKNNLRINQLPVQFTGNFEFLKNGYNMNFHINSNKTELHDLFTALPPEYLHWLDKTTMTGTANVQASLTGKYIAETNTMPDLQFNMNIRNGNISYQNAPVPVSNLYFDFNAKLPDFNTDSLAVNIDSLSFNLDKNYFISALHIKGMNRPYISAKINSELDMEELNKLFGASSFTMKGKCNLHFTADGKFATSVVKKSLRETDTIISSFPKFSLQSSLNNGYFKYVSLPQALRDINFNMSASCVDNNYHHTNISVDNINASVLNNYIKGYVKLSLDKGFPMDANFQSAFNLADIKQFYPLDSIQLAGNLNVNIQTKGKYNPAEKLFPLTKANISLQNGSVQTKYYPHPVEKIQVAATVTNSDGSMKDLKINLLPVSFEFEGQPFMLKANLQNFDDLKYNVSSKGVIDVGKIYKVFSQKGYDVNGFVQTDFSLRGLQSDATNGHYDKLFNSGILKIKNISLSADIFPKSFFISSGLFRFDQDKMWFDQFKAKYGSSDFSLNGYLSNVVNYAMQNNAPLQGNFNLTANNIAVDQFMAFADTTSIAVGVSASSSAAETGVVIVPSNLNLSFTATAKKITYNGIDLDSFKGQMLIDSGQIKLNQTGFTLIGAPVTMDAAYKSISPTKANFDYHINAQNFDIKRAYNEIKIFHDLATSAASAEGIVSLDYQLSGKLDANMHPVYPSLKGGGTLSLQKIKIKGLKVLGAVSRATNRDSISNPDLSKVDIKSTIANNIINIERTKMRVFGFRPRFEGQVSFNGKLNLQFRLGLPPLGIFGIPMTITGTEDNPQVKLRREKDSDKLEETEDKDDAQ